MANQTGRPIAPARKLVAAVLGTIAVFVMVFGLGLSSWAIVALGAALLALAIALGVVSVVRRGARAWVAGQGEVKVISDPPASSAYGRAELQLIVVAPGLPTTEVLVRDPRVPVLKWPRPGDFVPITVDVDDMRRVRIDWAQAADKADDGDPPPPPAYEPADEIIDDDLLGDVEPPPWATREREWGRGPDEPPPPPAATGADRDLDLEETADPRGRRVVVRDTPAGPVLEGQFIDLDDIPPTLPHRARAASGPGRRPGTKPSPRPHRAATATTNPTDPDGTGTASPEAAPQTAVTDPPGPADPAVTETAPTPNPADATSTTSTAGASGPAPRDHDDIDLPLDGAPEPPPETTAPAARQAVDDGIMAPPPDAQSPTAEPPRRDTTPPSTISGTDEPPPGRAAAGPPAQGDSTRSGMGKAASVGAAAVAAAAAGLAAVRRRSKGGTAPEQPVPPQHTPAPPAPDKSTPQSATAQSGIPEEKRPAEFGSPAPAQPETQPAEPAEAPSATAPPEETRPEAVPSEEEGSQQSAPPEASPAGAAGIPGQRDGREQPSPRRGNAGPWSGLDGQGYRPDERADDLITAYPSARTGPAGAIHGVGITVLVTDLDRSVAFYRDTLGFFEIDSGHGSAVLASGDTRLVLRAVRSLSSDPGRLIHLNLEVGDVEAVHDELTAQGVRFQHSPRPVNRGDKLELWAATFHDPDGHNIAITQWRSTR